MRPQIAVVCLLLCGLANAEQQNDTTVTVTEAMIGPNGYEFNSQRATADENHFTSRHIFDVGSDKIVTIDFTSVNLEMYSTGTKCFDYVLIHTDLSKASCWPKPSRPTRPNPARCGDAPFVYVATQYGPLIVDFCTDSSTVSDFTALVTISGGTPAPTPAPLQNGKTVTVTEAMIEANGYEFNSQRAKDDEHDFTSRHIFDVGTDKIVTIDFTSVNLEQVSNTMRCYDYVLIHTDTSRARCWLTMPTQPDPARCGNTPFVYEATQPGPLIVDFCTDESGVSDFTALVTVRGVDHSTATPTTTTIITTTTTTTKPAKVCGSTSPLHPHNIELDSEGKIVGYKQSIVGGEEVNPHSWPFVVKLFTRQSFTSLSGYSCGAAVLNKNWILTATHCVDNNPALYNSHGYVEASMGRHMRTGPAEEVCKSIKVIVHEDYEAAGFASNDIALIKVDCDITFNDKVQPICLPPLDLNMNLRHDFTVNFVVAGWGNTKSITSESHPSEYLKQTLLRNNMCFDRAVDHATAHNVTNHFCVVNEDRATSMCSGDSGGPVFLNLPGSGWTVFGINSYVLDECNVAYPQYVTEVQKFLPWIAEKSGGEIEIS